MGRDGGRPQALLIAGASATGKSALAAKLAEKLGGIVVNADSMQVYADLAILSARPGEEEMAGAPHALYGTVDAAEAYSVSRWLADVAATLGSSDRLPVIVGGTGLYFKALTQGLSAIPGVPQAVREEVRSWAAGRRSDELHAVLAARDPGSAARLRPSDPQRIVRALEVHAATGESLTSFQGRREAAMLDPARCRAITLRLDRPALRERLDRRFERMMRSGALGEVERLAARRLDPALPAMRALGVPPLLDAIRGALSLDDAVLRAQAETRAYAKRQETFLRHQLPAFQPVSFEVAEAALLSPAG